MIFKFCSATVYFNNYSNVRMYGCTDALKGFTNALESRERPRRRRGLFLTLRERVCVMPALAFKFQIPALINISVNPRARRRETHSSVGW